MNLFETYGGESIARLDQESCVKVQVGSNYNPKAVSRVNRGTVFTLNTEAARWSWDTR